MAKVERSFRGVPPAVRKAERRERLLEAALDAIGDAGLGGLTMTSVCQRAGLTERYFYESFRDKDALVLAAFELGSAELERAILDAIGASGVGIEAKARATANALVLVLTGDRRLGRLFVDSAASDLLRIRRSEAIRTYAQHLARKIRMLHGLESARDRARLRVATRMIVGGLAEALSGWLDGSLRESPELFVDEATHLCVALAASFERSPRSK